MSPTRAPRKYVDDDKTVVTEEWLAWRRAQRESIDVHRALLGAGHRPDTYLPEEYGKGIPETGAWILVLEEPWTELRARFRVPLLSMWRARSHALSGVSVDVGAGLKLAPQQAVIVTPGGDLHLWPHEYVVCSNPLGLLADPDATIHSLGGDPVLDEEALFYLQSRGIPKHEATLLLFETIESQDFVYVTFPEEITAALEGVGMPLDRALRLSEAAAREDSVGFSPLVDEPDEDASPSGIGAYVAAGLS